MRGLDFGQLTRRGLTLLLLVWLISPSAAAQEGAFLLPSGSSLAQVDSARKHLMAYRMGQAEELLYDLAQQPEARPAAWFYLTMAALHKALMSDEDVHFDSFTGRLDTLQSVLRERPKSAWRDYMLGEANLWHAVAHSKRGNYVRGALEARAAYRGLQRLVAAHPEFYEAYKGYGLLHLGIGSMPKSYRFILKILGYSGTITKGLAELRQAHRLSVYNAEEAGMYLAFANEMLFLSDEKALEITKGLYESDTTSTLYAHVYGFMLISNRQTARAVDVLKAAVRRSEMPTYFYNDYLDFYLAEALFRNDEFTEAEHYYRRYIDRHPGPALKAMAHLGIGRALEMQGKRSQAVAYYEQVRAARDFDTDEASRREADRLLARPLSAIGRELVHGQNAYDSGRYDRAERLLLGILKNPSASADQMAEAAYQLGRTYRALGRDADAIAQFNRAVFHQESTSAMWAPWAWFHIGKIWGSQGELEQAREAFENARSYRGRFDYYQALDQSIRAALELMEEL